MSDTGTTAPRGADTYGLEAAVGLLLIAGTWLAMGLVLAGVVLMLASGVDPLAHGAVPPFEAASIPADILALRPEGFLWAGIVLIIGLPIGRVVVAGVGFLATGDRRLALVSLLVFLVVLVSIGAALGLEG
ncbi:MAG TPA: DUF1634 domain-containing protein [Candidatus Limnocylindrales bacterium]|nr:DUF1634 domain-containing protein [Candidatus Limnocylindrales bacterium]